LVPILLTQTEIFGRSFAPQVKIHAIRTQRMITVDLRQWIKHDM